MKLYLIDGTFELFRAWFSFPSTINQNGQEVGATRGLLRSIVQLINSPGDKYIACAFDHIIESFRNELFSGYKTGEGIEPDLFNQFQLAEELVAALGVVVWPMIDFEADDALATAACRWVDREDIDEVLICSPDKDLYQVLDHEKIRTWDRVRNKFFDKQAVFAKLGVNPSSIPDYLALVGDTADGIPGIPRWGAKSTSQILEQFGTIENIPRNPEQWPKVRGAKTLSALLEEHRDSAILFKKLATLRRDVPLSEDLSELRWHDFQRSRLQELCAQIGDDSYYQRLLQSKL